MYMKLQKPLKYADKAELDNKEHLRKNMLKHVWKTVDMIRNHNRLSDFLIRVSSFSNCESKSNVFITNN